MNFIPLLLVSLVVAFTLVAAICDARTHKLPNRLTVPACLAGLAFQLIAGYWSAGLSGAGHGLLTAIGGFATGFGILFVLWLIGGSGAGDVKMMGALGTWLGAKLTLYVFILSAIVIAFASVVILTYQAIRRGVAYTRRRYFSRRTAKVVATQNAGRSRRRIMPYGVPLAIATWGVLAVGVWRGWIH